MSAGSFVLPYRYLAAALTYPLYSLTYKGIVQLDGTSAILVRLARAPAETLASTAQFGEYWTMEFFIDPSTFHVVMTQDVVPRMHAVHQLRYSNYKTVGGVLVPFSISEAVNVPQPWIVPSQISLEQIQFNTGLHDGDFVF